MNLRPTTVGLVFLSSLAHGFAPQRLVLPARSFRLRFPESLLQVGSRPLDNNDDEVEVIYLDGQV